MTSTIKNARDEIISIFYTAWQADSTSNGLKVLYDDVISDVPTTPDADGNLPAWARITVAHTGGTQGSLSDQNGMRRWTRTGIVTVQIFTPIGTGLSLADELSMIAVAAFEGKSTPSNIWFRNVSNKEIGTDGEWFQTNVSAEFTYDEVR